MDANTQLKGIRFSGENVQVSVYDELTSLNQQGKFLKDRCTEYRRELRRAVNMSLDSFLKGEIYPEDVVLSVRRQDFDNERDKKKSTTLKAACPAAVLKERGYADEVENQIEEYNSLVCMDFHGPEKLDWIKETLAGLPYVYYAGISSGKTGVFAVIPIVSTDWREHTRYFDELEHVTRQLGLNPSKKGRLVTDLRYQSIDRDAYFNLDCTRFSLVRPGEEQ